MRTGRPAPAVQITLTRQEHAGSAVVGLSVKVLRIQNYALKSSCLALAVNLAHRLPGAWVLLLRPYRDGVFASHNGDLRGLMMSPDLGDPAVSGLTAYQSLGYCGP